MQIARQFAVKDTLVERLELVGEMFAHAETLEG
jgi:hypothetical protein